MLDEAKEQIDGIVDIIEDLVDSERAKKIVVGVARVAAVATVAYLNELDKLGVDPDAAQELAVAFVGKSMKK